MSIITLTTDFGTKDPTVAAVKGSLLRKNASLQIVDISHHISPYNTVETAFILNTAYPNFPKGSIHIIGVNAEKTPLYQHLAVELNGHFFIGADNGIFSLLTPMDCLDKITTIQHPKSDTSPFPVLDVFVDIVSKIAKEQSVVNCGTPIDSVYQWHKTEAKKLTDSELLGEIVYVDHFGNLITDISKEFFYDFVKKKPFEISAGNAKVRKISATYHSFVDFSLSVSEGQKAMAGKALALFNSLNLLEVALYKTNPKSTGGASSLLGLGVGDSIRISVL